METASQRPAPLQAGVFLQFRFSPDGRYALVQDASWVDVLTVKPFAVLFRAAAQKAGPASFTPDSREVVFLSSLPVANGQQIEAVPAPSQVERWSVPGAKRLSATAIDLHSCETRVLSPDGRLLACVEFNGDLRLTDVESGAAVFEKQTFAQKYCISSADFTCAEINDYLDHPVQCDYGDPGLASIAFSSDGRFVAASPEFAHGTPIVWDTREKREVKLSGALKQLQEG